jgi:cytochrome c
LAGGTPDVVMLPSPLNAVAIAPNGEIASGGADGKVFFWAAGAGEVGELQAGPAPITALATSPDGTMIAAAGIGGVVAIIDRKARSVARRLVGPVAPVWSVAFLLDNTTLLAGGADGAIRRWNALTGESVGSPLRDTPADPLVAYAGDHGAEVFRACVACHTLSEKEAQRAGPTLAGLYGRRIASLPGYRFSDALKGMNIVWTPETVSKLFELGPNAYTPGTKMPEQRIGSAEDRKALTDFLARATSK